MGDVSLVDLTAPGIPLFNARPAWQGPETPFGPFDGVRDFTGPDTIHGSGSGVASSTSDATDLTPYIGTGAFTAQLDAYSGLPQGYYADADYAFYTTDTLSGGASITYTYSAPTVGVPEPAAWALMLVGLGGIGGVMRRRRDRATDGRLGLAT